jgi:di/tricarboxylate transporter
MRFRGRLAGPDGEEAVVTEIPRNVVRFERLMYSSLGLGIVVYLPLDWRFVVAGDATFITVLAIVVGLYVLVVWLVARRRQNWLRWVLLILLVVGVPFSLKGIYEGYRASPLIAITTTIQDLMQGLALYFVFTRDARPWFRKSREIDPKVFD